LNIPTSAGTNPTGSMFFSRGNMQGIDHRHYFRNVVFHALPWQFDTNPRTQHYERVDARFQIIIKGIDYGVHVLRISHNTRTDTPAYEQRNGMTQLHWGSARPIIAREDLLGRQIYLYKDLHHADFFVLEID